MPEPVSTTTAGASVSVGLMALLIGAFGPVAADVMLVVFCALAGCSVALSANKKATFGAAVKFILTGLCVSLALSWALSSLLISYLPSYNSPYTPSVIAFLLSFGSDQISDVLNRLINRAEQKINKADNETDKGAQ